VADCLVPFSNSKTGLCFVVGDEEQFIHWGIVWLSGVSKGMYLVCFVKMVWEPGSFIF
jgi:hypothetical protein